AAGAALAAGPAAAGTAARWHAGAGRAALPRRPRGGARRRRLTNCAARRRLVSAAVPLGSLSRFAGGRRRGFGGIPRASPRARAGHRAPCDSREVSGVHLLGVGATPPSRNARGARPLAREAVSAALADAGVAAAEVDGVAIASADPGFDLGCYDVLGEA